MILLKARFPWSKRPQLPPLRREGEGQRRGRVFALRTAALTKRERGFLPERKRQSITKETQEKTTTKKNKEQNTYCRETFPQGQASFDNPLVGESQQLSLPSDWVVTSKQGLTVVLGSRGLGCPSGRTRDLRTFSVPMWSWIKITYFQ